MSDESDTTSILTCRDLPGSFAREYIVSSASPFFGATDLILVTLSAFLRLLLPLPHTIGDLCINDYYYWPGACVLWLWLKSRVVKEEGILVMRDVGIQVRTTYWGGRSELLFIDKHKIDDIVINEGITMWQIKSYLAILIKNQDKMVVVFEHLLPRLRPVLLQVLWGTRAVMFSQRTHLDALKERDAI
ncbi:GPI-GlcNAc transferase complex, PIG-H component-domain-containing protein [Syncephalastrum racemosum]|uniref:GPI-GlcNAc transferase complex, PIG-H component-domain-containing protein n=1 Tax=Syncephalastrum racemosum TaxID=13706 RepID=A0A1X2HPG9_SYNRA|nr:GPI-GlcNAc transferase complex, PIG-H component-domain-containing protein [Syncephalastrum racemosum]